MLEAVALLTATLLVVLGVLIALGPTLPRRAVLLKGLVRRVADRPAPAPLDRRDLVLPGLHPTAQKAVHVATRIASLLTANGLEADAVELRSAARHLSVRESAGLRALRRLELELQQVRLEDESAYLRFRQLLRELHTHIEDRAEQLELILR